MAAESMAWQSEKEQKEGTFRDSINSRGAFQSLNSSLSAALPENWKNPCNTGVGRVPLQQKGVKFGLFLLWRNDKRPELGINVNWLNRITAGPPKLWPHFKQSSAIVKSFLTSALVRVPTDSEGAKMSHAHSTERSRGRTN